MYCWCLWLVLFVSFFQDKGINEDWQMVNNEFYSIKLPAIWKGSNGNDSVKPVSRNVKIRGKNVVLHSLIFGDYKELSPSLVKIENYHFDKIDKDSLQSWEHFLIETRIKNDLLIETLEYSCEYNKKKYVVLVKNQSMSVTEGVKEYKSIRYHLLFQKSGNIHHISVSLPIRNKENDNSRMS